MDERGSHLCTRCLRLLQGGVQIGRVQSQPVFCIIERGYYYFIITSLFYFFLFLV